MAIKLSNTSRLSLTLDAPTPRKLKIAAKASVLAALTGTIRYLTKATIAKTTTDKFQFESFIRTATFQKLGAAFAIDEPNMNALCISASKKKKTQNGIHERRFSLSEFMEEFHRCCCLVVAMDRLKAQPDKGLSVGVFPYVSLR
jgi:hypothetical protein